MTWETVTPYVILACTLAFQIYRESKSLDKSDLQSLRAEIDALSRQVVALETKIGPFWQSLQNNLSEILHRPTHVELDGLLEKLQSGTISRMEQEELRVMLLQAVIDTDESSDFRDQARLLLVVMPHAMKEAAQIAAKLQAMA